MTRVTRHASCPGGCGAFGRTRPKCSTLFREGLRNTHVDARHRPHAHFGHVEQSPSGHGSDVHRLPRIVRRLLGISISCALSVAMTLPSQAITTEQLIFLEAWRAVDRAYVDKTFNGQSWFRLRERYLKSEPMSSRKETYATIANALKTLDDPFTRFLEPSRYQALKRGNQGSVIGVGLEVAFAGGSDSQLVVVTPAPGGPADKAGVKSRDIVEAIDGKPTKGLSLYDAGDMLQGGEGSQVTLALLTPSQSSTREVTLTREKIANAPVSHQLCSSVSNSVGPASTSGKLGFVRIATFNKQTTESAKAAFRQLKADGASRYVIDVRSNGGGLFPSGVEVARMLMDSGDIVLIADSQGIRDSYEATGTSIENTAPVSLLVNKGTASASEVLAGALQDNKRATIAGESTFGKGLIQTIVELSDGSAVSVTVARYQTPAGIDINKIGIKPDILLDDPASIPTEGTNFCRFVAGESAPKLFGQ